MRARKFPAAGVHPDGLQCKHLTADLWASPSAQDLSILGKAGHHGHTHLIGITQPDRLGHVWILGETGTGKSTLLSPPMARDLHARPGFMLIDPHGDLVETLLALVPPERVTDMSYFHPADAAYPLAFNPLARAPGIPVHLQAGEWLGEQAPGSSRGGMLIFMEPTGGIEPPTY